MILIESGTESSWVIRLSYMLQFSDRPSCECYYISSRLLQCSSEVEVSAPWSSESSGDKRDATR